MPIPVPKQKWYASARELIDMTFDASRTQSEVGYGTTISPHHVFLKPPSRSWDGGAGAFRPFLGANGRESHTFNVSASLFSQH
jgi:hypothetical protein